MVTAQWGLFVPPAGPLGAPAALALSERARNHAVDADQRLQGAKKRAEVVW